MTSAKGEISANIEQLRVTEDRAYILERKLREVQVELEESRRDEQKLIETLNIMKDELLESRKRARKYRVPRPATATTSVGAIATP